MYLKIIPLVGINQYASNIATLPADAPSGIYEVAFTGSNPSYMYTIRAYNQGVGSNRPQTIQQLENANQPLIANGNYPDVSFGAMRAKLELLLWESIAVVTLSEHRVSYTTSSEKKPSW